LNDENIPTKTLLASFNDQTVHNQYFMNQLFFPNVQFFESNHSLIYRLDFSTMLSFFESQKITDDLP
jgi:hypothetical protein